MGNAIVSLQCLWGTQVTLFMSELSGEKVDYSFRRSKSKHNDHRRRRI